MLVAKLAMAESRARARVDALGMRNVAPLGPDERIALDVEYALARAEWVEALDDLRAHVYPSEAVMAVLARARC
jgi:hypothetical protein